MYLLAFLMNLSLVYSQSPNELKKLQKEYQKSKASSPGRNIEDSQNIPINEQSDLPRNIDLFSYDIEFSTDSITDKLQHFGYNFFVLRDTIPFWDNLPAPSNYLLGPGDELIVSLWGETQLRKKYIISRNGTIYDEKVGILNMTGKSMIDAEEYLTNQFGRFYSTLNTPKPSTYIDISLGTLRSINVNFVGEVMFPGIHTVHPFSNLISGLIQAGGIDTTGSLREINIKRKDNKIYSVDLYDYFINGESIDIQLLDQDIIVVPTRFSTVWVDSAVKKPAIYEFKYGESLADIIKYAGGYKYNASSIISLERIIPFSERFENKSYEENYYLQHSDLKSMLARDGDHIKALKIYKTLNQVEIIGQVKSPGKYHYYENMTLIDLLELSSGFSDNSFWKSVYQFQGELVRRDPETRYEKVIEVNLQNYNQKDSFNNIKLENLDRFVVHANLNYFERENVQIIGEVNIPGSYPLIVDNETLGSIIDRSGGLTSKALVDGISIFRNSVYFDNKIDDMDEQKKLENNSQDKVRVAWSNQSIIILPGDSILVKPSTSTVNVSGEVYNPGLIEYRNGRKINYYINYSGGITQKGSKSDIIVIYANGTVRPKKWYSQPEIRDGATIVVNQKEINEPFNITQFATNWTSIISSLITAVILSRQISPSN